MSKKSQWSEPTISELGDAKDLINGIPGGDKEVGGNDNEFFPLQIS